MLVLPIWTALGTKGAAAPAAAVGSENCKRGYSFGRHSFEYLPLHAACFDLASRSTRRLLVGVVHTTVAADGRHPPRMRAGSPRGSPRRHVH
jgi:hypothetical protein